MQSAGLSSGRLDGASLQRLFEERSARSRKMPAIPVRQHVQRMLGLDLRLARGEQVPIRCNADRLESVPVSAAYVGEAALL